MFARTVSMQVKPNSSAALTETMEKNVLPLLRKQTGFKDQMTFIGRDGREAFGISLWDNKESAEAYDKSTYPEVMKFLAGNIEGTPRVKTYEVAHSTFHKIATAITT